MPVACKRYIARMVWVVGGCLRGAPGAENQPKLAAMSKPMNQRKSAHADPGRLIHLHTSLLTSIAPPGSRDRVCALTQSRRELDVSSQ